MRIELRHRFPTSAEKTFEVLFSEDYEVAVAEHSGVSRKILSDETGPGTRTRRVHASPEKTFPGPVAKVLGQDRFSYVLVERHDLEKLGMDFKVLPDAMADKVEVTGSWALKPEGEGCERIVKIDVTVRIPIVGGRIEKQIGEDLKASYEDAARFALRWLQDLS